MAIITQENIPKEIIVVTKNADDFGMHNTKRGKEMVRIPAFAFLYLLGHAEKSGYRGIE